MGLVHFNVKLAKRDLILSLGEREICYSSASWTTRRIRMLQFDTLIIGSGLAGLSLALKLADRQKVAIITKKSLLEGASARAQGGIAAVLSQTDSLAEQIQDTLTAGAGLCAPAPTRYVIEHARPAIDWLIEQGVPFTRDANTDTGYH